MGYTTIPIKIGKIHRGVDSFGIKADGYPIFGFGRTLGDAHAQWLRACYAYMKHSGLKDETTSQDVFEERLLVANG